MEAKRGCEKHGGPGWDGVDRRAKGSICMYSLLSEFIWKKFMRVCISLFESPGKFAVTIWKYILNKFYFYVIICKLYRRNNRIRKILWGGFDQEVLGRIMSVLLVSKIVVISLIMLLVCSDFIRGCKRGIKEKIIAILYKRIT